MPLHFHLLLKFAFQPSEPFSGMRHLIPGADWLSASFVNRRGGGFAGKRVVKLDVGRDLVPGKGYLGGGFCFFAPASAPFDAEKTWHRHPCFCDIKALSALRDAKKNTWDGNFWCAHKILFFKGTSFAATAAEVWIPTLYNMQQHLYEMRERLLPRRPRTSLSDCQQGITWSEITKLAVSVLWVSFKIMMHLWWRWWRLIRHQLG